MAKSNQKQIIQLERFLEAREQQKQQNKHKTVHEQDINQIQKNFQQKIKQLQKQLISKKSIITDNLYNSEEKFSLNDPILTKTSQRSKASIKTIIANVQKHNEYDDRIEKIMKKYQSMYDVNEQIIIEDESQKIKRRQNILIQLLQEINISIDVQEKWISQNDSLDELQLLNEKKQLHEKKLNAKMFLQMIENNTVFKFNTEKQQINDSEPKQTECQHHLDTLSLPYTDDQKDHASQMQRLAEKQVQIRQNIKTQLSRMGILPKRINTLVELKLPQITSQTKLTKEQYLSPKISYPNQAPIDIGHITDITSKRHNQKPQKYRISKNNQDQYDSNYEFQNILDKCSSMHKKLKRLDQSIGKNKSRQIKKFSSMNYQLEQVKHSSFIDNKLMLVE